MFCFVFLPVGPAWKWVREKFLSALSWKGPHTLCWLNAAYSSHDAAFVVFFSDTVTALQFNTKTEKKNLYYSVFLVVALLQCDGVLYFFVFFVQSDKFQV